MHDSCFQNTFHPNLNASVSKAFSLMKTEAFSWNVSNQISELVLENSLFHVLISLRNIDKADKDGMQRQYLYQLPLLCPL